MAYGWTYTKVPETTRYRSELVDNYSRDFYGGWSEGFVESYDRCRERAALTGG